MNKKLNETVPETTSPYEDLLNNIFDRKEYKLRELYINFLLAYMYNDDDEEKKLAQELLSPGGRLLKKFLNKIKKYKQLDSKIDFGPPQRIIVLMESLANEIIALKKYVKFGKNRIPKIFFCYRLMYGINVLCAYIVDNNQQSLSDFFLYSWKNINIMKQDTPLAQNYAAKFNENFVLLSDKFETESNSLLDKLKKFREIFLDKLINHCEKDREYIIDGLWSDGGEIFNEQMEKLNELKTNENISINGGTRRNKKTNRKTKKNTKGNRRTRKSRKYRK